MAKVAPYHTTSPEYAAAQSRPSLFKGLVKPMSPQTAAIYMRDLLTADQAKGLTFEARTTNVTLGWSEFQGTDLGALISAVMEIDGEFSQASKT